MTKAPSILGLLILILTAAGPLGAQEAPSYPYGYLSHVEGEITLQRATEAEPESGAPNVPVMPGDRLWTPSRSRAEMTFAGGTRVRIDERTKLDVVETDAELILRLWNGSVIVVVEESTVPVRIDTPSGSVFPAGEGLYRVDVEGERVALSVTRGSAELATSESSVVVDSGQTSETVSGSATRPYPFNTARLDAFDRFSESLDAGYRARTDVVIKSLPHEVTYYARELHNHGEWYREPDYGWVWYPYASVSWAPYRHGRWQYTRFGYTWISYEPWGWAPYHYGRWGYGHRGWYWIPGASWGPAWVSFAFGPSWVGWSPLGFHGRPVFGFDTVFHPNRRHYRGGHAVPRSVYDGGAGWNFVGQQQFNARSERARLRTSQVRASADRARLLDSGAVLGRDLRPRERSVRASSAAAAAAAAARPSRAIERRTSRYSPSRSGRVEPRLSERPGQVDRLGRRDAVDTGSGSMSRSSSGTRSSTLGATARSRYGNRESETNDSRADRDAWRERASSRNTVTDRGNRGSTTRSRTSSRGGDESASGREPARSSGTSSAWRERAGRNESSSSSRTGSRPSTTRGRTDGIGSQRSSSPRPGRIESGSRGGSRPSFRAPSRSGSGRPSSSAGRPARSAGRPATAGSGSGSGSSSGSGATKARRRKN